MNYVLDLTTIEQPTLALTLPDGTKVSVTIPSTDLVREFQAADSSRDGLLASGTKDGLAASYDLIARLLSSNLEGITITGADLEGKHRVNLYGLLAIGKEYKKFFDNIEKN